MVMEIKNLTFSYTEQSFLEDLSATIEKVKITTILGPNGCGKSTLLNLLVNQLTPSAGEILLDDQNLREVPRKEMAKQIAMVHQQNCVPADTTVERLIQFGRMPHQTILSSKDEDGERMVQWAMKETNLTHMAKKRVGSLSGGERQRAWIAMALAQKTDLLFLDEPTTYLDIFYQLEILSLVRRLNREYGMTIVMVLHDINQAIQFSDRLIIMKKGCICYAGDVKNGITKERLQEVYGIRALVQWSEQNHCPYIVPLVETA